MSENVKDTVVESEAPTDVVVGLEEFYAKLRLRELNDSGNKALVDAKVESIRALKEILGAMIQNPVYDSDPNAIGTKKFSMYIQEPIVTGDKRDKVLNKLIDIIDSL